MGRQQYNLKILGKLKEYFITNPDIRFFQGLWNVGIIEVSNNRIIIDKYNLESETIFNDLKENK